MTKSTSTKYFFQFSPNFIHKKQQEKEIMCQKETKKYFERVSNL